MRILMVGPGLLPIPGDGWGAVERVIWETAEELRRRGHKVRILNSTSKVDKIRAALWFPRLVEVHWELFLHRWWQYGRVTGARVVSISHSGPFLESIPALGIEYSMLEFADEHWCLSPQYAALLKEYYPDARVERIRNGVRVDRIRHGVPGNGRALYLAVWREFKGQERAWSLLRDAGVPCDFVGPDAPFEPGYVEGSCRYLGEWSSSNVEQRLGEYSALVLASKVESAEPLVVMEAQAAGVPVVVTPEVAANFDDRRPGVYVGSIGDDFVSATMAALGASNATRRQIREHAEQQLSWGRVVDRIEELIAKK